MNNDSRERLDELCSLSYAAEEIMMSDLRYAFAGELFGALSWMGVLYATHAPFDAMAVVMILFNATVFSIIGGSIVYWLVREWRGHLTGWLSNFGVPKTTLNAGSSRVA